MYDPFLHSQLPLRPGKAAVALLLLPDSKYLLQLRDPLPHIFYPDHWGCFGGGVEDGETPPGALVRELREELNLQITAEQLTYFTRFTFDFNFVGLGNIERHYYILQLEDTDGLELGEGADMRAFTADEALNTLRLMPYDSFAIWIHCAQQRFR